MLPPELAGLAGPPAGAPAGSPAPGDGLPGQPDNPDSRQALEDAISALDAYMRAERDPQDRSVAAACLAKLHALLGGRAKEFDSALGVTPQLRFMRRTLGS